MTKEKGRLGESIFCKYLEDNNINYWTNKEDNYNPVDFVVQNGSDMDLIEVNTKDYYNLKGLQSTGKNTRQINAYKKRQLEFGKPFYLVFIDFKLKQMYGAYLDVLLRPYNESGVEFPYRMKTNKFDITFFSVNTMSLLKQLSNSDIEQFIKLRDKDNQQVNIF